MSERVYVSVSVCLSVHGQGLKFVVCRLLIAGGCEGAIDSKSMVKMALFFGIFGHVHPPKSRP